MKVNKQKFDNDLVNAIESKNEHQFRHMLEILHLNPNQKLNFFNNLSTFEKVLSIPNSQKFIEICLQNGSDFYRKNSDGFYPIYFAVNSFCTGNLKTILKIMENTEYDDIKRAVIMNQKLDDGNNYLHFLVSHMTEENENEIFEMVIELMKNGCNSNTMNDRNETPFDLLPKLQSSTETGRTLKEIFTENSNNNFRMHDDAMQQRGVYEQTTFSEPVEDVHSMIQIVKQWNETKFIQEFESSNCRRVIGKILDEAIVRNLWRIVEKIVKSGIDVNRNSKECKLSPAFLACKFGYFDVLKVLLSDVNLRFENEQQSLLHQLFETENIDAIDRQKCFDLIVTDPRCTYKIINDLDDKQQPPLFYACHNKFDEIAQELLRRGAFIGHKSVISNIDKDVLNEFLDEAINCSGDLKDKDCEIHVDYRFLMNENSNLEVQSLRQITKSPKLKETILHPVISSFLYFKWKKIDFIVYFNLLVYFSFMMFLGFFIVVFFHNDIFFNDPLFNSDFNKTTVDSRFKDDDEEALPFKKPNLLALLFGIDSDHERSKRSTETESKMNKDFKDHFNENVISYRFCVFGVVLMAIYEVVQFLTSYKKYFFKTTNWLDISMIVLSYAVLLGSFDFDPEDFRKIRALMILIMAAQTIQLVSKVSFLSMSLHMAIFKKVCATFLKTIALYLIMILAFAMSFYTLNDTTGETSLDQNGDETFSDPMMSIITTVRMMLSDFENVKVSGKDRFEGFMFLLFVILITVVLFNLLNALAISDTNDIIKDAELVDAKKRISILHSYEKIFNFFNLTFANIFPDMATISFKLNKDTTVKGKRRFEENCDNKSITIDDAKNQVKAFTRDSKIWNLSSKKVTLSSEIIEKIQDFTKQTK